MWNHISRLKPSDESADGPAEAAQPRKRSTRRREKPAAAPECSSPTTLQMHRESARENAPSTDPQSIVAIEQLIPKPHKCHIGEDCPKAQHHKKIIRKLQKQHGFLMSPEDGDRLYLVASPISNPNRISALLSEEQSRLAAANPLSSTHDLEDGVSACRSTPCPLRQVAERDPQENVKAFLALQQLDASQILPLSGRRRAGDGAGAAVAGPGGRPRQPPVAAAPQDPCTTSPRRPRRRCTGDHSAATTLRPPTDQPSAASKFSPRHTIAAAHHSLPRVGSPQRAAAAAAEHGGYAVDAFAGPAGPLRDAADPARDVAVGPAQHALPPGLAARRVLAPPALPPAAPSRASSPPPPPRSPPPPARPRRGRRARARRTGLAHRAR